MKKGKIAGEDTYDYKADGTEKTAEEKTAFMLNYQIEKMLGKFEKESEFAKTLIALKDKVNGQKFTSIEEIEQLKKDLNTVSAELKAIKEQPGKKQTKSLVDSIKENKAKIKEAANKAGDGKQIVIKTVVERASIVSNSQALDLTDVGQLATRKLSLYDLFPKITIGEDNNGVIRYRDWNKDTIVRAAASIAEKGTFPESTAVWLQATIPLQKIGDTLPVTEEFFEDEEMFAAELNMFLNTNVALIIDQQLYSGDGSSNTLTGLFASVSAYTNVTDPTKTIQFANIYDLIKDAKAQITRNGGAKYSPDFVVMNITDINKMNGTKSTFGTYVIPPFVSADGMNVSGVQVIESNIVTENTMVIGDRRFAKIYEKGGITLSQGVVNAQFTADEMTLKARKRLAFLIRSADANGFLKVTSISASVAALATPAP